MDGFPFQVLEYFLYKSSLLFPKFVFLFPGMELLFETGKVRNVYPVTVWVSGVSQTAKTEV